jgi:hypothetical protein
MDKDGQKPVPEPIECEPIELDDDAHAEQWWEAYYA